MIKGKHFVFMYILFVIISTIIVLILCYAMGVFNTGEKKDIKTETERKKYNCVVIDAGHGGEDGGTSSAGGLCEKDVNLDIAQILCDMYRANGVTVVMTRTDDRLLYDRNVNYMGRKKALDLAARLKICEETPDSIFLSIHMNAFTDPKYSGLQVWYSPHDPDSQSIAYAIQTEVEKELQKENKRKIKKADSKIYILDNARSPAVLVECGFLSNPDEAKRFESEEYRQMIAFTIFAATMDYLEN